MYVSKYRAATVAVAIPLTFRSLFIYEVNFKSEKGTVKCDGSPSVATALKPLLAFKVHTFSSKETKWHWWPSSSFFVRVDTSQDGLGSKPLQTFYYIGILDVATFNKLFQRHFI